MVGMCHYRLVLEKLVRDHLQHASELTSQSDKRASVLRCIPNSDEFKLSDYSHAAGDVIA
jgi:hypothetical protein